MDTDTVRDTARALTSCEGEKIADEGRRIEELRAQTHEVRILQDIFDIIVAALGGQDRYPRPVSALEEIVHETHDMRVREAGRAALAVLAPHHSIDD